MNCKEGDLAVIIEAIHPENVGVIVEVIARGPDPSLLPYWHTRAVGNRIGPMTGDDGTVHFGAHSWCYDFQLRPIRGEPEQQTTEREEALYA